MKSASSIISQFATGRTSDSAAGRAIEATMRPRSHRQECRPIVGVWWDAHPLFKILQGAAREWIGRKMRMNETHRKKKVSFFVCTWLLRHCCTPHTPCGCGRQWMEFLCPHRRILIAHFVDFRTFGHEYFRFFECALDRHLNNLYVAEKAQVDDALVNAIIRTSSFACGFLKSPFTYFYMGKRTKTTTVVGTFEQIFKNFGCKLQVNLKISIK